MAFTYYFVIKKLEWIISETVKSIDTSGILETWHC